MGNLWTIWPGPTPDETMHSCAPAISIEMIPGLGGPRFDTGVVERLRIGPLTDRDDVEVAVPLVRVIHDELETFEPTEPDTSGE